MTGFGFWAIEDRVTGRLIGEAGFHDLKRDMTPSIDGLPEAGWSLVKEEQGRGFGAEVVSAVVAWGDTALAGRRQVCIIDPLNHASIKVAEKCGFRNPVDAAYNGEKILLFERWV
jgi:RimJ/RimL family protein N-acetyltransferase